MVPSIEYNHTKKKLKCKTGWEDGKDLGSKFPRVVGEGISLNHIQSPQDTYMTRRSPWELHSAPDSLVPEAGLHTTWATKQHRVEYDQRLVPFSPF